MSIRRIFALLALGSAVVLVATGGLLFKSLAAADLALGQERLAQRLQRGAFELTLLTADHVITASPRARRQWRSRHAALGRTLAELASTEPANRALRASHQAMGELFDRIVAGLDSDRPSSAAVVSSPVSRTTPLQARLIGFLLARAHEMTGAAQRISAQSAERMEALLDEVIWLQSILAAGLVLLAGASWYVFSRRILAALRHVHEGLGAFARGALDYRIPIERDDEIATIARNANAMARAIREVTVSRDAFAREVEVRAEAERRLADLIDDVKRSNEELEQFCYVASHDLQEPLRKVRAFSDRLLATAGEGLSERSRDYLGRIEASAGRMQQLVDDLLALSRVSSNATDDRDVDLQEVVDGVLRDLEQTISDANARVEIDELPTIRGKAGLLRQLFSNLISNALKFRAPGRVPRVTVSHREIVQGGSRWLAVSVRDNGIGFEPKQAERIMEPFQRLHGRTEYPGTGIGLAICARVASRHRGTLIAESEPGAGSCFTVRLPLTAAGQTPLVGDVATSASAPSASGPGVAENDARELRIGTF